MKRSNLIGAVVGAVAGLAVSALAGMEDVTIVNDQSIAVAGTYSNSSFIRGEVMGVLVKIEDINSAVRTNTVAITSADGQTIFSKACVGVSTNFYPILVPSYTTAGAAVSVLTSAEGTNQTVYVAQPVASKVTALITGGNQAGLTNNITVKIVYKQ